MNLRIVGTDDQRNRNFQQQAFDIGVAQPAQVISSSVDIASRTSSDMTQMLSNTYNQLNQVIDAQTRANAQRSQFNQTQLENFSTVVNSAVEQERRIQQQKAQSDLDERRFRYQQIKDRRDFEYRAKSDAYDQYRDERDFQYRVTKDQAGLELDLAQFEFQRQSRYQDLNQKILSEAEKQRSQAQFVEAFAEISNFTSQADFIIAQSSAAEFERQAYEMLSKYPYISNTDRVKLLNQIHTASGRVRQDQFSKLQERNDQINAEVVGTKQAELDIRLSGVLGRLKNARNGESSSESIKEADDLINKFIVDNPDLDPLSTVQIYRYGLDKLKAAAADNADLLGELEVKLEGFDSFYEELMPFAAQYNAGTLDFNTYLLRAQQLGKKYGVPSGLVADISDPNAPTEMVFNQVRMLNELNQIEQDEFTRQLRDSGFYEGYTADLAFVMINDRVTYHKFTTTDGIKDSPYVIAAKELADQYEDYRNDYEEYSIFLTTNQQKQASWNSATLSRLIKKSTTPEAREDLLKYLKETYPGSPPPPELLYDEENEEALEQWLEWREYGSEAILNEAQAQGDALRTKYDNIFRYGLNGEQYTTENYEQIRQRLQQRTDEAEKYLNDRNNIRRQNAQQQSFFNGGYQEKSSYEFATLKDPEGRTMYLPFRPGTQVEFRHGRGEAGTARAGNRRRAHAGIDINAPVGTPIASMVNGTVIARKQDPKGYGLYLDILAEDGTITRYAHLQGTWVTEGDRVSVGQEFAKVGKSGNAANTPAHLHMELRNSQGSYGYSESGDIEKYLRTAHEQRLIQTPKTRRNNSYGNAYTLQGGIPLGFNGFMLEGMVNLDGEIIQADKIYNQDNPLPAMNYTGWNLEESGFSGKNDFEANYGYSYLENNPHVARKLNEISDRLGVPGHWIADLIAHESKWKTNIDNGVGYTGLIQFSDAAAQGIGTTRAALRKMNHVQQLEYVYKYFNLPQFRGKLKSVAHVLAAVWGGARLVNKLEKEGFSESVLNYKDIWIDFRTYLTERLGRDVGRKYNFPFLRGQRTSGSALTHDTYTASCPVCNELQASNSFVVHEGLA